MILWCKSWGEHIDELLTKFVNELLMKLQKGVRPLIVAGC